MSEPRPARVAPYAVEVEAGRTYWWCVCGRSASQPFCDGSHRATALKPVRYVAERREWVWFCGCKQTARQPFCDGSHRTLAAPPGT